MDGSGPPCPARKPAANVARLKPDASRAVWDGAGVRRSRWDLLTAAHALPTLPTGRSSMLATTEDHDHGHDGMGPQKGPRRAPFGGMSAIIRCHRPPCQFQSSDPSSHTNNYLQLQHHLPKRKQAFLVHSSTPHSLIGTLEFFPLATLFIITPPSLSYPTIQNEGHLRSRRRLDGFPG